MSGLTHALTYIWYPSIVRCNLIPLIIHTTVVLALILYSCAWIWLTILLYNAMHNQSVCDWWETRLVDYRAEQSWANIACRLNHPRSLLCMTWKQILSDSCLPIVQVPLQLPLLWYEAIGLIRPFSHWEVYTQYHNTQPVSQPILFCYDKPMYGILQRFNCYHLIW